MTDAPAPSGVVSGGPAALLRLEGALACAHAVLAYRAAGARGWMFVLLFLAPDLSMLGYLSGRRFGAAVYNAGHSYLTPFALALAGRETGVAWMWPVALIWVPHIGFDRLLGYGLKYPEAFGATHLGLRGRASGA